jgi:hypothetical protein
MTAPAGIVCLGSDFYFVCIASRAVMCDINVSVSETSFNTLLLVG